MKKQAGFTLIELVIVVVILGFLAVTAIPKFLDLTDQAKEANIEGMAGGFATGVSLVRAQWESEGQPQTAGLNTVNYDGTVFTLTTPPATSTTVRKGYPMSTDGSGNEATAVMNDARCIQVWNAIFSQPATVSNSIANVNNPDENVQYYVDITTPEDASTGGNNICAYYLKESLNKDNNNNYLAPSGSKDIGNLFTYNPANSSVVVYVNN